MSAFWRKLMIKGDCEPFDARFDRGFVRRRKLI
jgi:hypothetical protein